MIVPRWASFSGLIAISSTPIASAFIVTLVSISNNASSACAAAADALAGIQDEPCSLFFAFHIGCICVDRAETNRKGSDNA